MFIFCVFVIVSITTNCCHGNENLAGFLEEQNAPGALAEYKVQLDAQKEDCYFQYVHPSATLYVTMEVIKGGDGKAGMLIKDPNNVILHPYSWQKSSEYEGNVEVGGYYSICIDNQFSKFASKIVNIYISTFRYDLWEKYAQNAEEINMSVGNFTASITLVDQRIKEMLHHQSASRSRVGRDYRLMLDNTNYVFYWSLVQCVAISVASLVQVYAVKRFFVSDSKSTSSMRA